jgi:exonuclease III
MGDFNVAMGENDLHPDANFWYNQGPKTLPDLGDIGFGGTTYNEIYRAHEMVKCGDLVDTYAENQEAGYFLKSRASSYTFRGKGKFINRGGRYDYILADSMISVSGGVDKAAVCSDNFQAESFMGSDHCPVYLKLGIDWKLKLMKLGQAYQKWEDSYHTGWTNMLSQPVQKKEKHNIGTTDPEQEFLLAFTV